MFTLTVSCDRSMALILDRRYRGGTRGTTSGIRMIGFGYLTPQFIFFANVLPGLAFSLDLIVSVELVRLTAGSS
jgi:hypothetical protein